MSIVVGGKTFKSKASLTKYCRYVLNQVDMNKSLSGEWGSVLKDVVRLHPRRTDKIGDQDFEVHVRRCPINPSNKQFYIVREDGEEIDFSYTKAISGSSISTEIKRSLRDCVQDQVNAYKRYYFATNKDKSGYVICPVTNLKIKPKDSHVDHYPKQLDELIKEWVESRKLNRKALSISPPKASNKTWTITNGDLVSDFQQYHLNNAQYRVVLNKVNLQRGKSPKWTL